MPVSDRGCPTIALACGMCVARQGLVSGSGPRNCARPRQDAVENLADLRYLPQGRVCYWGGLGGSLIVMNLDRQLTFSYAMNKLAGGIIGSDRGKSYIRALERSLP
jgi:hypothetical protein